MGNTEPVGDGAGIADILPGAAAARPPRRRAMVIELERDADRLGAGGGRKEGERRKGRTTSPPDMATTILRPASGAPGAKPSIWKSVSIALP
jgi:hypothetical protein